MRKIIQPLISFAILLAFATACNSSPEPTLHLFIWSAYIKPESIEEFKKLHHCQVVIDTYDSNESMYAKLKLGATGYDVIFPSNYFMDLMSQQNMIQKIDLSAIPNYKNLDPEFLKFITPDLLEYGVPYMVSAAGIGYRTDRVESFELSWNIFGNDAYKGRMTMLNDVRETMGAALKYLGYSPNTISPEEIEEAANLLINWKQDLAKFDSEQYKAGLANAEYLIVHGYNGDIMQIIQENPNVAFAYPIEGVTLSMDFMVIPADAPNSELAHAFINFLLDGKVAAENIQATFFFSPNLAAYDKIPQELLNNPALFPPKNVLDHSELIHDLGPKGMLYNRAWDKVKAR